MRHKKLSLGILLSSFVCGCSSADDMPATTSDGTNSGAGTKNNSMATDAGTGGGFGSGGNESALGSGGASPKTESGGSMATGAETGGGLGSGEADTDAYCPTAPEVVDSCEKYCSCWFERCAAYDGLDPKFADDFSDFETCSTDCNAGSGSFGLCREYLYYRINNNPISHCNDGAPTAKCPG